MQWICSIAMFMVLSGIVLELIADTRYYKFARWVSGVILLLQFIRPLVSSDEIWSRFLTKFSSFDYALGTDRVLEDVYFGEEYAENAVLTVYKDSISEQIGKLLEKNGLKLISTELAVSDDGSIKNMRVWAVYLDGTERPGIVIPTVVPVRIGETPTEKFATPLELYIREMLADFYQIEESSIEVIIQEAE